MRTIIIAITLIIIAILSIPLYLVTYIIGLFSPSKKHAFAQKIVSIVFRFWLWISGTDYTIYGLGKGSEGRTGSVYCQPSFLF